jgi:hypothetical protein
MPCFSLEQPRLGFLLPVRSDYTREGELNVTPALASCRLGKTRHTDGTHMAPGTPIDCALC